MVLGVLWALRPQEGDRGHAVPWTHTHEPRPRPAPHPQSPKREASQALVTGHRDSPAEHGAHGLGTPHTVGSAHSGVGTQVTTGSAQTSST